MKDYYTILGVSRDASGEEIKRVYRALARRFHPDRSASIDAEERFKEITEAYAVLSHPERRTRYDREGVLLDPKELANEVRQVFWDIVSDIFPSAKRRAKKRVGKDIRTKVLLTLEESIFGATREVQVPRRRVCDDCDGQGGVLQTPKASCPACQGKGEIRERQGLFSVNRICERCGGQGVAFASRCRECYGKGERIVPLPLLLTFPPGLTEGKVITVRGAGAPGEGGGKDGDLDVEIVFEAHPFFTIKGSDFWLDLPIRLDEAFLGSKIAVPTPDSEIMLKIPPKTQSGRVLKVAGRGGFSIQGGRGDLFVRVLVETPVLSEKDQKRLAEILTRATHEKRQNYLENVKSYVSQQEKKELSPRAAEE